MFSRMKKQLTTLALICSLCLTTYGKINEEQFFNSLAKIESSGNPNAVNRREQALGIYQIRFAYFKDSGVKASHKDVFDPKVAKMVCKAYFARYEKKALDNGDWEVLARLHNAGPNWRKNKSSTDKYWNKIKKHL
jgi:soluble lytic murein transglycosylase-like protein